MWIQLVFISRVLAIVAGLLLIYLALFLYEDEQGKIQNTLEELWIKIDQQQHYAIAKHLNFMQVVSRLVSVALNRLLGEKLFSIKSTGVSACYSTASIYICGTLIVLYSAELSELPNFNLTWNILKPLVFIILSCIPMFLSKPLWLKIWFASAVIIIICFDFIESIVVEGFGASVDVIFVRDELLIDIGIILGIVFDVFFIAATRRILRWRFGELNYSKSAAIIIFNIIMALTLFFIPILILSGKYVSLESIYSPSNGNFLLYACFMIFRGAMLSNFFIALFAVFFVFLTVAVLVQRIFWPLLARPIYSLQKLGIAKRSKFFGTVGTVLIAGGIGGGPWVEKIVEKLNPF